MHEALIASSVDTNQQNVLRINAWRYNKTNEWLNNLLAVFANTLLLYNSNKDVTI